MACPYLHGAQRARGRGTARNSELPPPSRHDVQPAPHLSEAAAGEPMVQSGVRSTAAPWTRCAIDGAGDHGAGLAAAKVTNPNRAALADLTRERVGVPAESQGEGSGADQREQPRAAAACWLKPNLMVPTDGEATSEW